MSSFKFGQKDIASQEFNKPRQVNNIFTNDLNKIVLSERVPCNNKKYCQYIVGYQQDKVTIIPLFIKTTTKIFS